MESDPTLTREGLLRQLVAEGGMKPRLFVWIPPPENLNLEQREHPIEATDAPEHATYLLAGRVRTGKLEYAWVLPNITRTEMLTANALPMRTSWVTTNPSHPIAGETTERLQALALRLGRLRTWMQLESPPDDGTLPYKLLLKQNRGLALNENVILSDSDTCGVVLQLDLEKIAHRRFVHLFALDSNGEQTLLFPKCKDGNKDNYFPRQPAGGGRPEREVRLRRIIAKKPYGTDTLIFLTTQEAIPDPCVLEGEAVRGSSVPENPTPLELLLQDITSGVRTFDRVCSPPGRFIV